jgi:hypothetical protein
MRETLSRKSVAAKGTSSVELRSSESEKVAFTAFAAVRAERQNASM